MDESFLGALLGGQGIFRDALTDGLARAREHFAVHPYSPEAAEEWAEGLLTTAPHLFTDDADEADETTTKTQAVWERLGLTKELWDTLPATERLTRARADASPPIKRRPQPYAPTPEQVQALEGKSAAERLTLYRQWRDRQG